MEQKQQKQKPDPRDLQPSPEEIERQKKEAYEKNIKQDFTFGQKLVGADFNPSGDIRIARLKALFAEAADIVYDSYFGTYSTEMKNLLYGHTIGAIKDASMNSVNILTLKH